MKICYFGIYLADFGRNKIYINALKKAGHTVFECNDTSSGFLKFWRLWKKHKEIENDYDFMIVGYPGHMIVPFAKLLSKKPVVADLLGSLYDAEVNSHNPNFWIKIKAKLADFLAVRFADRVLLESEAQKNYFIRKFGNKTKYKVVYTGADDIFNTSEILNKNDNQEFLVLFRGRLTAECGIRYILEAANILKANKEIKFLIIGRGPLLQESEKIINEKNLQNVNLIKNHLEEKELINKMKEAFISLGQFENNPRLNRTIPHKAYESFALGIPYLSGDAPAIKEIVEDNKNAFLCPLADPEALTEKILFLSKNRDILDKVARNAKSNFENNFSALPLAKRITESLK